MDVFGRDNKTNTQPPTHTQQFLLKLKTINKLISQQKRFEKKTEFWYKQKGGRNPVEFNLSRGQLSRILGWNRLTALGRTLSTPIFSSSHVAR